jgi:capsid protein
MNPLEYDAIPADRVLHWYKVRRPGQLRGVPDILAALPLFAYLRRLTLASVASAEIAANYAAVLTSDLPPPGNTDTDPEDEPFDKLPAPRAGMVTLPRGYGLTQLEPKHPAPNYRDFKGEILTETGATVGAPRNVSTGSSAEYNYSSGRLDHLPYERMICVLRSDLREVVLDPVFREWVWEARRIEGVLPPDLPPIELWSWEWHYDGFDSIDPLKDAQTDETELRNNTTTLAEVYAKKGKDWEEAVRQRAKEQDLLTELGLSSVMSLATGGTTTTTTNDDGTEQTASTAAAGGGVQSTALNGPQIQSLLLLADKVVMKQYPADAATALVRAAFPLMSPKLIDQFIKGLVAAPTPEPTPNGAEQATAA